VIDKLFHVWNMKKAIGTSPSIRMTNTFIEKLILAGELESAIWFLQNIHREGLKPNLATFLPLITASAASMNVEGIQFWLECMKKEDVQPATRQFAMLLEVLSRKDDREGAEKWLLKILEDKPKVSEDLLKRAFEATEGDKEKAVFWLELAKKHFPISDMKLAEIYAQMLSSAGARQDGKSKQFWQQEIRKNNEQLKKMRLNKK